MTHTAAGITPEEADRLFADLSGYALIAVAVSGGPDSMALLHLLSEWRQRVDLPLQLVAVTVDHQLRTGSAEEAAFVADRAKALGLNHRTLTWQGPKPTAGLPEAARDARYRLLAGYMSSLGATGLGPTGLGPTGLGAAERAAVATAHHRDDQAETVLMRLMRGSGLEGLSAMAASRTLTPGSKIKLVRPLLGVPKARLIATLEARGETWIDDPTNTRQDLERGRVRKFLGRLEDEGPAGEGRVAEALSRTAVRLGAAGAALDYAEAHFQSTLTLATNDGIYASLDRVAFGNGPALLQQRVLAKLVADFGGASPKPELAEVEALAGALEGRGKMVRTLGGAVVSAGPRLLRIFREAGRLNDEPLQLEAGQTAIWDKRFEVALSCHAGRGLEVRALGPKGFATLSRRIDRRRAVPARAAYCLPAFWRGDILVGVPPLASRFSDKDGSNRIDGSGEDDIAATAIYRN